MTVRIEQVDWLEPRAVAQRAAMDVETGAMYAVFLQGQSAEGRARIDEALAVDPATIAVTILAVEGDEVLGHSALRPYGQSLEVKKVFVEAAARGRGVARLLMAELETIAKARGVTSLVLQTGPLQVAAIALYEDIGYRPIPSFGKYDAIPGAVCFEKAL